MEPPEALKKKASDPGLPAEGIPNYIKSNIDEILPKLAEQNKVVSNFCCLFWQIGSWHRSFLQSVAIYGTYVYF